MTSVCDLVPPEAGVSTAMSDPIVPDPHPGDEAPARTSAQRVWISRLVLAVVLCAWLARAWWGRTGAATHADWTIQNAADVSRWLRGLAWRELLAFASLFAVGLLVPPAFEEGSIAGGRLRGWRLRLSWLLAGCAVVIAMSWMTWGEFPRLGTLVVPLLGYLVGVWFGAAWLRSGRALVWAGVQLALLLLSMTVATIFVGTLAVVDRPLDFEPVRLTEEDKHRLAEWIRDTRPPEGQPRQLRLADSEIDALLNAGLSRGLADRKARVQSEPGQLLAEASIVLPERWAHQKYVTLQLGGEVSIEDGKLRLHCEHLKLGRITVPPVMLAIASPIARALILEDPQIREIVGAIQSLETENGAINTVFRPGALGRRVVPSLAQLVWGRPDVAAQTEIYVRHLVDVYDTLPPHLDRFGLLMQSAFRLAAQRSVENDPVLENRAAIFALAILLGADDLEPFVGELLDPALRAKAARMMGVVMLRGRQDWPRHFLVSAALALLSSESASDRIGLLKERLDAQQGGSGFSFGDLLADRAGTRFALAATRDAASARAMQVRLAGGFDVAEFFPPADGLPEGIPDEEFTTRYGGVDGAGYQTLSDEIDRRLARLPAM